MNEYDILSGESLEDLINKVNAAIKEGWRTQGGVSQIGSWEGHPCYAQAMLRTQIG